MKLQNKVIVFDLDGTLLDEKNNIIGDIKTLNYLNILQNMGCILTICTGRLDHDIIKINEKYQLNIENHISQNGAVYMKNGCLHAHLLHKQEALDIYQFIANQDVRIELNTVSSRYWKSERDPDFPRELYDSHIICQNYEDIILYQPAVLFLIVGKQEQLTQIADYVNTQYHYTKAVMTSKTSLEIMNKEASKGHAIELLYPNSSVYSIGDSPNDFDMFPVSKQGYLVSNQKCQYQCKKMPSILESLEDIIKCIKEEEK